MAALIRQLHDHRLGPAADTSADLGQALREALAALGEISEDRSEPTRLTIHVDPEPRKTSLCVQLMLAARLPPVAASGPELRRLCLFLLRNSAAAVKQARGTLTIRAEAIDAKVRMRFEDNGPPIAEDVLQHPFEPAQPAREGADALELAACRSIAHRLRGTLTMENLPGGGVRYVLELPTVGSGLSQAAAQPQIGGGTADL